jgi:hypothetical protein
MMRKEFLVTRVWHAVKMNRDSRFTKRITKVNDLNASAGLDGNVAGYTDS